MAKDAVRQSIADCAKDLTGSHYLWGSGGATPGAANGAAYRPGSVTLHAPQTDPKNPKIFAATCNVAGYFVCAGRYDKIPGGRPAHSADQDLVNYLRQLPDDTSAWQPYCQWFSPRMVEGSNVTRQIVWGEDCRARRHFDCISFVNYVLTQTTIPNWSASIAQYTSQTTEVNRSDRPVPGDILTRGTTHIGILDSDGHVIQAEMSSAGVHADEVYNASRWTRRGRLADSVLPNSPYYP
jgi:cell wall-associated NlpC family hydrolase